MYKWSRLGIYCKGMRVDGSPTHLCLYWRRYYILYISYSCRIFQWR